ncbi:MAG: VWA domain-containing protein [Actinobacteria bacterium]|nr:MAG: VWA domain-containing protein [Actinomycetota bacterium]
MKRLAVALGILGALVAAPAAADPGTDLSVSGVTIDHGHVRFTVTADHLPPGVSLDSASLSVDLDGVALPATVTRTAAPPPKPREVVLIVDTSGSMAGARLAGAKAAADGYADGLPADVALGLVSVADAPVTVLGPTRDRAAFKGAVAGLAAHGGTALYDGVRQAVTLLSVPGERRVVLLSDGTDTASHSTAAQAAADLSAGRASLDVIAYGPDAAVSPLAVATGGRIVTAADPSALRAAFAGITATLAPVVTVAAPVPTRLAGTTPTMHVTLSQGGTTVATATGTPVALPAGPPLVAASIPRTPRWPLYLALGATGGGLLLGGLVVMYLLVGRATVRNRLRQIERAAKGTGQAVDREPNSLLDAAVSATEQVLVRRDYAGQIEVDLDRAGIDLRPAEWTLLRIGVAVLGVVLAVLALPLLPGLLLGGLGGWFGTAGYRRLRATRRARRFADQLPESLQLVVSALRSGFSFPQAIAALAQEGDEAVAGEFGRALAESRLGGELEEALLRVATRMDSRDLAWLVMAIRVQREVGGTLSEVLETAVETMRERARLRRHVRGLSAEGRLSAWVLAGMPVMLAAFMFTFRAEYLRPLYTTPIGLAMLTSAVLMMAAGTFWLSKVVKVEV